MSTETTIKNETASGSVPGKLTPRIHVSVSPHVRSGASTTAIMRDVALALLPACAMGVYAFGWRALAVIAVCIASCVLTELVYEKLMKLPVTVGDLSAVVTGVILAVNMPVGIPLWMPALGGVFAILVVKQLFGGLGHNIMNPALAARCFLLISFAAAMTSFPETCRVLFGTAAQSGSTPAGSCPDGCQHRLVRYDLQYAHRLYR